MMIVIIRYFRTVIFDEKCGRGHPVLIYIKKKSEFAGIEKNYGSIKNYTWIC